ncbi:hypothetical protein COCMIDRAFT_105193 [Bipolaris oryzae ATCC 44560]|uniref:Uncharacterized protein n=1 Tax=Bipolaris oryzae ATCC 44560 TaxID=930090 RepID=W6YW96_COCMI|nr:uncharacterized protein COCMIDRAFT_105193 [Bipolaris oryzae ATCC 44560]EUC41803.1 hypothetical protein COCMIDRAFT_105193 [Bipolaris oryzae ATCC 44560]
MTRGPFKLFDLPRELRDKIYYQYLYRPGRVYYTAHDRPFWETYGKSDDFSNLFTVSKQVYHEAFNVFCEANTIALSVQYNPREDYSKPLTGLLRLFPERAAASLTRVSHTYRDIITRAVGKWGYAPSHGSIAQGGDGTGHYQKHNSAGETFVEILRDAEILRQFFPKLIVFEAGWFPEPPFHEYPEQLGPVRKIARLWKEGVEEGKIRDIWLDTMQGWLQGKSVVPLSCIQFSLNGYAADGFGDDLDVLFNEAYIALVKERTTEDDIEDSGRAWLEAMDKEKTTRKKTNRKKQGRKTREESA